MQLECRAAIAAAAAAVADANFGLSITGEAMNRRKVLKNLGLLLGVTVAAPGQAFDLGKAVGAAQSMGKAATITDADLKRQFDQMTVQYDKKNTVAQADSPYAARLGTLTSGLAKYDGLNLNFKVYLTKDVNAFAMGNGTVRIYSGLMDLMTDDEIRYVIGHEIGHIKAGHSKARMKAALTTDAVRGAVAASDSKAAAVADSQIGELFQKVILAQHSQANENEADDYAMGFLKKTKHEPMAAVTALDKLTKLSGGGGGWLATHPAPAERAKRMRAKLA
jgi:putative metalloprotease